MQFSCVTSGRTENVWQKVLMTTTAQERICVCMCACVCACMCIYTCVYVRVCMDVYRERERMRFMATPLLC